ncbi:MAG: hypothetical protein HY985_08200 [Magnetospirillum sp.]|nr:hypothetical protein [Magnetospirillum sp.]
MPVVEGARCNAGRLECDILRLANELRARPPAWPGREHDLLLAARLLEAAAQVLAPHLRFSAPCFAAADPTGCGGRGG